MKSNFQKMHSALTDAYMVLTKAHMDDCPIPTGELVRVLTKIELVLALKPRNCDIGTAEEQEERFTKVCTANSKDGVRGLCSETCPFGRDYQSECALAWAQMSYEEGDNDGE